MMLKPTEIYKVIVLYSRPQKQTSIVPHSKINTFISPIRYKKISSKSALKKLKDFCNDYMLFISKMTFYCVT